MAGPSILGISGSAAEKSYNSLLLRAFGTLLPEGFSFEVATDLQELPFYDPDLDANPGKDLSSALRLAAARADAVVIATPEYN